MNYTWLGVIILFVAIIIVIIVIVVLNRGNTLDIVATLPRYKIYNPIDKTYLQISNNDLRRDGQSLPIGNPFWNELIVSNNNDSLIYWTIVDSNVNTSFDTLPTGSKYVKIANTIYESTSIGYDLVKNEPIPSNIGYIQGFIQYGDGLIYAASGNINNATILTYITVGTNLFQLKRVNDYVNIRDGFLYSSPTLKPEEAVTFQLVI